MLSPGMPNGTSGQRPAPVRLSKSTATYGEKSIRAIDAVSGQLPTSCGLLWMIASFIENTCTANDVPAVNGLASEFEGSVARTRQNNAPAGRSLAGVHV